LLPSPVAADDFYEVFRGLLPFHLLAVPRRRRKLHQLRGLENNQPFGDGTMDDELCRQFFRQPQETFHRRYEALRAFFLGGQALAATAERFGYRPASFKSLVCRFRASCANGGPPPFSSPTDADALLAGDGVKIATAPNLPTSRTFDD
jgi:hypothetical protein